MSFVGVICWFENVTQVFNTTFAFYSLRQLKRPYEKSVKKILCRALRNKINVTNV